MNRELANAFNSLRNAGATNLPSASEVENSPDGTYWINKKKDSSSMWVLTKNKSDSYNVTC